MANDGKIVGYFFALLTVIGALPLILLCIRYYRHIKYSNNRIEKQLETSAIDYMMEARQHVIEHNLEQQRNSLRHQSKQFLNENARKLTNSLLSEPDNDHFKHLLRQQHTFWGIKDFILKEGKVWIGGHQLLQLPSGLCEDFLYYVQNNVNPITFLFASERHPQPMISRFVSYTTAQTFVLLLYLIVQDSTVRTILNYLFSPLTILIEYWLNLMLVCPCLPEIPQESMKPTDSEDNNTTQASTTPHIAHKAIYHSLRIIGWFLAFPILFVLVTFLVLLSIMITNRDIEPNLLGMFILDGILIPFLIKLTLVLVDYLWFFHPTHVNVCSITVLTINSWTETQTNEYLMYQRSNWTDDQRKDDLNARKRATYSEVDIFHCTCNCIQFIGYHRDSHYSLNICEPSCYCTRCCDAISAWYWEEDEAMKSLLPTPARHSMASTSPILPSIEQTERYDANGQEEQDQA